MQITETTLKDALVIQPKIFQDERGYFFESFKKEELDKYLSYKTDFVQENESYSKQNVFRGFHFQDKPKAQAKLVRVVHGKVLDIIIDIREFSPTFGQVFQIELSAENKTQLYVPRFFAHGFIVLSDDAIFQYKCDNYYSKEYENGLNPFDETLKINWPVPVSDLIINERDKNWKKLQDLYL